MSLRSILGRSSRVKKASKSSGANSRNSPSSSSSSSWTNSLPRSKPTAARRKNQAASKNSSFDDDDDDIFGEQLDDCGLIQALGSDLSLRDTAQAIYYIRNHMFSPIPEQAAGMNSTKIAEVLNYRKRLPAIVTVTHIQALLISPSAVERELAELARSGFLRKIVVPRRGDIGETLIMSSDFEKLVRDSPMLSDSTKESFLSHLRLYPATQAVNRDTLSAPDIASLVKAGFLTSHYTGAKSLGSMSSTMNLFSRPEDKGTLISIETVSRQATGSLGAVGGEGAVHNAGGSGGGSRNRTEHDVASAAGELKLAIPGNATFLNLLSSALDHLVSLLGKSRFREAPETLLRDRWDGGIAKEEARYAAKRSRREFAGILPGQTRKWRQFHGLSFEWILQEAVGAGLVEVFNTGSVGRGIRATC